MAARMIVRGFKKRTVTLVASLLLTAAAGAQQATITPNYKDADIRQIIEAVGEVTGKNFVLDPRVKAQVTMLSATPMTADAFYEAFLSILQVYGFVAVESGNVIKILPDANARQFPGAENQGAAARGDEILTQVVQVQNVAAAQLVPILRPLIPQYGHLAAHPASNMLIISDRAANVDRMVRIIKRIDQAGDEDYEVIRLEHASATEIQRIVTALNQTARGDGAASPPTTVVADERTNSLLVSGDRNDRLRIRALITHLDTPLEEGGNTRVRYLRYADAASLAEKLQSQFSQPGAAAQPGQPGPETQVWADEQTNALIITAPPKVMSSMLSVVDKLDIRRMQVLVEAIIVEVMSERAADLGVTWAVFNDEVVAGVTDFPTTTGALGLGGAIAGAEDGAIPDLSALAGQGLTGAVGRLSDSGTSFAAVIEALEGDANSNILGTPVLVTMDNEEAEIKVGQEVPFVTGSFTNTGTAGAAVNPFQTIEREQVGLTLKLTPQINEGDAVLLNIEQEVSNLSESTQAVDLITNNRTITTSVIVEDAGTLVLGGLIREDFREREDRVPVLGSLPLLGVLFRATSVDKTKTNLMIFIKPTILRNDAQALFETNAKYRYMQDVQNAAQNIRRGFLDKQEPTVLPELGPDGKPGGDRPVIDLRLPQEPAQDED